MIRSRRRFLNRGYYDRLSVGLNQVLASHLAGLEAQGNVGILDAGCGEGFYLKNLKSFLAERSRSGTALEYYGVDISKFAIRQATQRDKAMTWIVASVMELPFMRSSVDVIVSAFAATNLDEFSRVLNRRGVLVLVTPGPNHLKSLRETIYSVVRQHKQAPALDQIKNPYSLSSTTRIAYQTEIEKKEDIMDLLAMTPYFWNIDLRTKSRIEALDRLNLDIDVCVSVFEKTQQERRRFFPSTRRRRPH